MYYIAEVSSNHASSLERSIKFIEISKEIGCDAVKFQLFKLDELFSIEARKANPKFEDRRKWELPVHFLPDLKKACLKNDIDFSCTPFYLTAVEELEEYVDFFKIASYELLWLDLLEKTAKTGKKIILSTGMASIEEIDSAVEHLMKHNVSEFELLHCISGYPTALEDCNLSAIEALRLRYGVSVGWSDHSVNPVVVFRAVNHWQASTVEFHLDLDGEGDEFKTGHCWLPDQIGSVISGTQNVGIIDGDGVKAPALSEAFERGWRADPSDGLRPLLATRKKL